MHSERETRIGHGHVTLSVEQNLTLTTHERGAWEKGMSFSNSFRFRFATHAAHLEHLRFGSSHPVLLCELIEQTPSQLASKETHVCGQDHYKVKLKMGKQNVHLIWDVKGPNKAYQLHYTYR